MSTNVELISHWLDQLYDAGGLTFDELLHHWRNAVSLLLLSPGITVYECEAGGGEHRLITTLDEPEVEVYETLRRSLNTSPRTMPDGSDVSFQTSPIDCRRLAKLRQFFRDCNTFVAFSIECADCQPEAREKHFLRIEVLLPGNPADDTYRELIEIGKVLAHWRKEDRTRTGAAVRPIVISQPRSAILRELAASALVHLRSQPVAQKLGDSEWSLAILLPHEHEQKRCVGYLFTSEQVGLYFDKAAEVGAAKASLERVDLHLEIDENLGISPYVCRTASVDYLPLWWDDPRIPNQPERAYKLEREIERELLAGPCLFQFPVIDRGQLVAVVQLNSETLPDAATRLRLLFAMSSIGAVVRVGAHMAPRVSRHFDPHFPIPFDELYTQRLDRAPCFYEPAPREITVAVFDICGSSTVYKTLQKEFVEWLNSLLGNLVDVVHLHNGTIDKFTGDGFIAYFNAYRSEKNHAACALSAAIEACSNFLARVKLADDHVKLRGETHRTPLGLRVGIASDSAREPCQIGRFGGTDGGGSGERRRWEYTAVGRTVIAASRIAEVVGRAATRDNKKAEQLNGFEYSNDYPAEVQIPVIGQRRSVVLVGSSTVELLTSADKQTVRRALDSVTVTVGGKKAVILTPLARDRCFDLRCGGQPDEAVYVAWEQLRADADQVGDLGSISAPNPRNRIEESV